MMSTKREVDTPAGKLPLPLRAIGLGLRATAAVSPRLAAWGLERLFRTPKRQAVPAYEQTWLSRAQYTQLRVGEYQVATWSWGTGPAVLLVHGWGGRGSQLGAFIEPLVSRGYRVVAFDAPGHGQTNGTMSSLPEISDALAAVARHVGPVHAIIAHSVGTAATTLALRFPLQVERLVYIAPPVHPGEWLYWLADVLGVEKRIADLARNRLEGRFGISWSEFDSSRTARAMTAPLLIVHDTEDGDVPWDDGRRIASAWPGSELVTTSGLGHRRVLRDSDVVTRVVSYLSGEPQGAGSSGSSSRASITSSSSAI